MQKITLDEIYNSIINKLKNELSKEEIVTLLIEQYVDYLDSDQLVDLYEKIVGDLSNTKVVDDD